LSSHPITVTVDVPVSTGITVAVVASGARPADRAAPTTLAGKIGVVVTDLAPRVWDVYAKVTSTPETRSSTAEASE
jgi:hypothetical protein